MASNKNFRSFESNNDGNLFQMLGDIIFTLYTIQTLEKRLFFDPDQFSHNNFLIKLSKTSFTTLIASKRFEFFHTGMSNKKLYCLII
jgi:hypothetical protein